MRSGSSRSWFERINNAPISKKKIIALVEKLKPQVVKIPELTTFEITTALGFLYFSEQGVDAAVFEVGLGGRLDATNIVTPAVSVITSISYDHMFLLGNTLTEIATEKAGIIKPGVPVVVAPQVEEAKIAIHKIAKERNSPLIQVGRDVLFEPVSKSLEGQTFSLSIPKTKRIIHLEAIKEAGQSDQPILLTIPLLGYHQVENAATAFTALMCFNPCGKQTHLADIERGFRNVVWEGRFEILQKNPIVIVDCAHNRDSARRLRETLEEYFPDYSAVLIFGASEDKDIPGMLSELAPRVSKVIATKSFHPRAIEPTEIGKIVSQYEKPIYIIDDVADALKEAMSNCQNKELVLVTGSIFVVASAREAMLKMQSVEKIG
jgi:dihydrofolate synthase/folylpolyglutamate synthase